MKVHGSRWAPMQRWLRRLLGLCFGLLVLSLAAVFVLAHSLERVWVRERVAALALAGSGLGISYGAADFRTSSELDLRDLVVRSPGAVHHFAPELLRVGRLRLSWWRVPPFGWWPALRAIEVEGVKLNVVRDEQGRTSFDSIPFLATPSPPLSQRTKLLLGSGFPIPTIHVNGLTLVLIQTDHGSVRELDTLSGLTLSATAKPLLAGSRLELMLGSSHAPLELTLDRVCAGASATSAVTRAFLSAEATPTDASAVLDVQVIRQNLAPQLAVAHLLRLEAHAQFDPSAGRVELAVTQLTLADDTATNRAALELPDHGALQVHHAAGEIDTARLVRLAAPWAPGVELSKGNLRYQVDDLALDRPLATTLIAVDAELEGAHAPLTGGSLTLANAHLSLHARPNGKELAADGVARLDGLELRSAAGTLRGTDLVFRFDGRRTSGGALSGQADFRVKSLALDGASPTVVRNGHVTLLATDLRVDPSLPLTAQGALALDAEISGIEAGSAPRCSGANLKLHAETSLAVREHFGLVSNFSAEQLELTRAGRTLVAWPLRGALSVQDFAPDLQQLERSSGTVQLKLDAGALHASLEATKRGQALNYQLSASARQLADARAFAPEGVALQIPWEKMAFELEAKGTATQITSATPELEQRARLHLTGAAIDGFASRALTLELHAQGSSRRQRADLALVLEGLRAGDNQLSDEHLKATVDLDRSRPSLQIALSSEQLAKAELHLSAAFDAERRALTYRLNGQVSELAPLSALSSRVPALADFDLSKLALRLESRGSLDGVFSGARADGSLILAPRPLATAKLSAALALDADELRWADGDRALATPAATLRATFEADAERRVMHSDLAADQISFGLGRHRLGATAVHDQSIVTSTGPLSDGALDLEQHASIGAVAQNFAPMYTVGDVVAELRVRREPSGLIHIDDVAIDNRAAGTTLRVQGGLDLGDLRRLSLRTTLTQDLSRLSNRHDLFSGTGNAQATLLVESPDFRVFHNKAELKLDHAHIRLPSEGVALDGIEGDVPIAVDLTYGRKGVELLRGVQINPYATLRFADQHPLLSNPSFISIASLTTPFVSVAPFAANLGIEQNIVSLSQLEMGVRGGIITGDGVLDWNGAQSSFQANLRASGVLSSHGEPFDGNAAFLVDLGDRSIDGRADILRIGQRHLLDLLDLEDPEHENSGLNRVRTALHFGYPEHVRIAFKHGFASAGVDFGGLASLIRVDEVRGIPVGPLMERLMSSFNTEAAQ